MRRRMEYPDLKRAVYVQAKTYGATLVLIEDHASGTQLIQELVREGQHSAKGYKPEHHKVMRLRAQTATIENGLVFVPREAPWLAEYIHELTTFPNARYCDQADSTSQALAWINQAPPEPAIITYYHHEAARKKNRGRVPLDMIAAEASTSTDEVQNWLNEPARARGAVVEVEAERIQRQRVREHYPGISRQELHRHRLAAGSCRLCGENLLGKRSIRDALGHACFGCAQKNSMAF